MQKTTAQTEGKCSYADELSGNGTNHHWVMSRCFKVSEHDCVFVYAYLSISFTVVLQEAGAKKIDVGYMLFVSQFAFLHLFFIYAMKF